MLDSIARDGVLFDQAVSVAPLTLPAHSSIFTGKFPPEHGVRDNGGFFLGPDQVTLAEVLKQRGYRTGGFVAAYVLDSKWGIDQGFDTYVDDFDLSTKRGFSLGAIQRPANEVMDKALPWIRESKGSPFFAWIHLYDPHAPYRPPEPFASRYKDRPYNGEIAFTDSQVGRLVSELQSLGVDDRTILVVMGDHGESLGDHGESAHGFFIYNSVTHVPFLIRSPFTRTQHRRVADPVRSVDVMPTVLDLLGVPLPAGMSGVSLTPLMTGAVPELGSGRVLRSHVSAPPLRLERPPRAAVGPLQGHRRAATGVVRHRARPARVDQPVLRTAHARRAHDRRSCGRWRTGSTRPSRPCPPPMWIRRRASVSRRSATWGRSSPAPSESRSGRADPKDKIGLFNKLGSATDLARERDDNPDATFGQIVALLNEVVRDDPTVIDAWFMMGTQYLRHNEPAKAVEYFKRTLTLKPDYDLAVMNLAQAYRRLGDDDAALAGFEHYLKIDPKDPFVHYQIGEIWMDRGDLPRAEQLFRHVAGAGSERRLGEERPRRRRAQER